MAYSESLFLFLTICSIYLLDQNKFAKSILVASLIPLTRFIGIFVVLANILHAYNKRKDPKLIFALTIAVTPFLLYLGYLNQISGDTFLFSSAQSTWGRFTLDPVSTIFHYLVSIFAFGHLSLNSFFDLVTTLTFLLILIKYAKKLKTNVWVFSMLAILVPATTGTLTSMPRYVLASLGVYIIIGEYLSHHHNIKLWVWSTSLALQAVLLSLFVTGHWVA